jgi:hypothetical protein
MSKKKVKSKKASLPVGPAVITTNIIRRQRDRMNCPRIGDAFCRTEYVDEILEDVAERILLKASTQKSDTINLSSMRINHLPDILAFAPDLRTLLDINLSRNNLFNSDHVFEVIHGFVETRLSSLMMYDRITCMSRYPSSSKLIDLAKLVLLIVALIVLSDPVAGESLRNAAEMKL